MKVGIYDITGTLYIQKDEGMKPVLVDTTFSDEDPDWQGIVDLEEETAEEIVKTKKIPFEIFIMLLISKVFNIINCKEFYKVNSDEDIVKEVLKWAEKFRNLIILK